MRAGGFSGTGSIAFRLALAQAASGLLNGAYMPFFTPWLAARGLSAQDAGILLASAMLLRVIISPLTGIIADARNDRRGAMLFLGAVMCIGYFAINWVSAAWLLALAIIPANICGGSLGPLLESVSVRLSERFDFDYGHVRLWASAAFVAANLGAGVAVTRFGIAVLAPWLAVAVALQLLALYLLPAPPADRSRGDLVVRLRATFAEVRELSALPVFLLFLLVASMIGGSHAFYYNFAGLHWRELGYSGTLISVLWPLGILIEIALFSFSLRVFRAVGAPRLLLFGALGCVLRWTILAFDPPLPLVVFAQFLHGATFALGHLGGMYFILKAVPPRLAATAQSLYSVCAGGIGLGAATLASGALYASYGGRTYLLMTAMGLVGVATAWLLGRIWQGAPLAHIGIDEALDTI